MQTKSEINYSYSKRLQLVNQTLWKSLSHLVLIVSITVFSLWAVHYQAEGTVMVVDDAVGSRIVTNDNQSSMLVINYFHVKLSEYGNYKVMIVSSQMIGLPENYQEGDKDWMKYASEQQKQIYLSKRKPNVGDKVKVDTKFTEQYGFTIATLLGLVIWIFVEIIIAINTRKANGN